VTEAHGQKVTNSYIVHFPDHAPREEDPHYKEFHHIRSQWEKDPDKWQCAIGKHRNDFSECDLEHPFELHHNVLEFSLLNAVEFEWLKVDYPGIYDAETLSRFAESPANLEVLCRKHHRGHGGIHHASASDWEAQKYIRGLIT
jgi:hypothetical protein